MTATKCPECGHQASTHSRELGCLHQSPSHPTVLPRIEPVSWQRCPCTRPGIRTEQDWST